MQHLNMQLYPALRKFLDTYTPSSSSTKSWDPIHKTSRLNLDIAVIGDRDAPLLAPATVFVSTMRFPLWHPARARLKSETLLNRKSRPQGEDMAESMSTNQRDHLPPMSGTRSPKQALRVSL